MSTRTVAKQVPQSIEAADRLVRQMGEVDKEISASDNKLNELKQETKRERARNKRLKQRRLRLHVNVQAFADAHRDELTEDRKVKHFFFPGGGRGQWRFPARPKLLVTGNPKAIIRALKRRPDWLTFVRVKEELNLDALKNHPDVVAKLRGARIDDSEYFTVDP